MRRLRHGPWNLLLDAGLDAALWWAAWLAPGPWRAILLPASLWYTWAVRMHLKGK